MMNKSISCVLYTIYELRTWYEGRDYSQSVGDYTRVCTKFYEKTQSSKTSKSLLDVVIQNNEECKTASRVIGCPFSDHKFVLSNLSLKSAIEIELPSPTGRSLSPDKLAKIEKAIKKANFSFINDNKLSVDDVWLKFKVLINKIVDKIAPLKVIKFKKKEVGPWVDQELAKLKILKEEAYFEYEKTGDDGDALLLRYRRSTYQSMNRSKMKEYFESKTIQDFKNSKKFWQFYSSTIYVKSDKSSNHQLNPTTLYFEGKTITNKEEFGHIFNKFFTSLKSISISTKSESEDYINQTFQKLIRDEKKLKVPDTNQTFSFSNTTTVIVSKIIKKLITLAARVYLAYQLR